MNQTIYKQLDSRWSKLPYPTKNSTFGANGCGCCACTHIAIEQDSKRNWNPTALRKWMVAKGYAVAGKGTLWSGITETLKYIGHKSVVWVQEKDPMSMAWKELNKGNRIGVLLVDNSRTPDRTYWTSSGHYVAFTDYKITDDGKHWFYVKDSGARNHSGWYCYEKSIKGALPQLWIVERLGTVPKKTIDEIAKEVIDGKWGNGDERVKKLKEAGYDPDAVQKRVNELLASNKIGACANEYAYTTNTSKASYKSGVPTTAYKSGLDKAYPDRSKWGTPSKKGASCDVFVGTCVRNAGVDKSFPRGLADQIPYLAKSAKFKEVSVTTSTAKNGDIIVYTKTKGGGHICIVYDGKIKEAAHDSYYPKTTDYLKQRLSTSGKKMLKVYRAVEETPAPKKTVDELAKEVLDGKWGSGDERKKRLTEAGYDYDAVQKKVNEILAKESWVDKANAWAKKIAADNTYHYVKWKSKDVKTHECPICHNHPVGYSHGWNCIGFAFACWHHGGGLLSKCSDGVISNEVWEKILYAKTDAEALAIAQKHVGLKDLKVIRNKNGIPKSQWKAGDIMGKFNGSKYIHTYYYMGNGKIAESTGSSGKVPVNDQIRIKSYDKTSAKVIVRYLGK